MSSYNKAPHFIENITHSDRNDSPSPRQPVEWLEVQPDQAGQRLDNFLITYLKGTPKSHVYQLIRTGQVRVNKSRCKPLYKLCVGDCIRIPPRHETPAEAGVQPNPTYLATLQQRILYEDESLLILNKPAGWAVHGGSGLPFGIIEALRVLRPELPFLELAHRLDRDTSGCLLLAKQRSTLRQLHELLREQQMQKRYLALLQGQWRGGQRLIEQALEKNKLESGERRVKTHPEGKAACTRFTPLATQALASLMQVEPLTGRTHQIRVHAQYCGHPVIGDKKYGAALTGLALPSPRLFLHALQLEVPLNPKIRVVAPLDPVFQQALQQLQLALPRDYPNT